MLQLIQSSQFLHYIGGVFVPSVSQQFIDCVNPATGQVYAQIANAGEQDVAQAVVAAQKAFPKWSGLTPQERAAYLNRIAELIDQNLEALALAESEDNGKPLSLAKSVDIPRAAANFRFFANAVQQFAGHTYIGPQTQLNYTVRKPLGVVGCISPWNLPLYLFTWKIAPALAAGNCVVAKPSEVTPRTAYLLAEICQQANLPIGVLNIVHGLGATAGDAIVKHPDIKAISFTGGTNTGRIIARAAAPMFKKISLELGGKNPVIVFADCDFNAMLDTVVRSSFSNQGQICLCGSRIFVEKSLYSKFKQAFVQRVQQLQVGDPLKNTSNLGAIVSEAHFNKVLQYITLAKQEGGTILCGGHAVQLNGRCANGWFIAPTVVEGLAYDCRVNQEEVFGPMVSIMPFETEEEVLQYANSTEYGLAASLWTNNVSRVHSMANAIEAGIVWVNCWMVRDLRTPFGGMKSSGVGREGGEEALRFFTEAKNICIQY